MDYVVVDMNNKRFIKLILSIMMFLSMAVSCTPTDDAKLVEDDGPYISGLGIGINAYQEYDGWIYYIDYPSSNLYKVKSNGEKRTLIVDDPIYSFDIYEDRIFYTNHKFYLYSANIDGSVDKKFYSLNEDLLPDDTAHGTKIQAENGWIYILNDYRLYKIKTDGTEKTYINFEVSIKDFCVEGDKIYYCTWTQNEQRTGLQLWKMAADGSQNQQLMQESALAIDYDEDWIYYISMDDNDIYKVAFDGNEKYKIAECNGRYIKAFGDWIFYEQYGEKNGIYKIRKDGCENTCIKEMGDWKIEKGSDTYIIDDRISYYGVFDQWLLCYGTEISAIKFDESSETDQLTYDIISEWSATTIYD